MPAFIIRTMDVLGQISEQKVGTRLVFICCLTIWGDVRATLCCSHKVNVKLHSAAALQQWAFKLIWLAVWNHTQARVHRDTHRRARADTATYTRAHARAGLTANTDKVSDIATCTGKGKVKMRLPWALCRGVSHHHTFSYFSEFTKIVSKAVCGQRKYVGLFDRNMWPRCLSLYFWRKITPRDARRGRIEDFRMDGDQK